MSIDCFIYHPLKLWFDLTLFFFGLHRLCGFDIPGLSKTRRNGISSKQMQSYHTQSTCLG
jgi:hypothetical protein